MCLLFISALLSLTGLFSMNVTVPANDLAGNRYDMFGIVIALAFVIIVVYGSFVRLWWVRARRRRGNLLKP